MVDSCRTHGGQQSSEKKYTQETSEWKSRSRPGKGWLHYLRDSGSLPLGIGSSGLNSSNCPRLYKAVVPLSTWVVIMVVIIVAVPSL